MFIAQKWEPFLILLFPSYCFSRCHYYYYSYCYSVYHAGLRRTGTAPELLRYLRARSLSGNAPPPPPRTPPCNSLLLFSTTIFHLVPEDLPPKHSLRTLASLGPDSQRLLLQWICHTGHLSPALATRPKLACASVILVATLLYELPLVIVGTHCCASVFGPHFCNNDLCDVVLGTRLECHYTLNSISFQSCYSLLGVKLFRYLSQVPRGRGV